MSLKNLFAAVMGVIGVFTAAFLFGSPFAVTYLLLTQ